MIRVFVRTLVAILAMSVLCSPPAIGAKKTVVLTNGNVIRGDVKQLGAYVSVRTATAELRLPPGDVEMVVGSVSEAYKKKARKLPKGTSRAAAQDSLILWCLRNDLLDEAKQQLANLQQYSPNYPNLAFLDKRVTSFRPGSNKTRLPKKSDVHPDTELAQEHLTQLSKQSAADYVRTVQPLLMNRCAMAGCHGKATDSEFRLIGSRRSMPSHMTHRNLGATLRRIDGPSEQSLLWMSASSIHGGMEKRMSDRELKKLYDWIDRVGREVGAHRGNSQVRQVSAELPVDGVDPFDPAKFNALQAGTQE